MNKDSVNLRRGRPWLLLVALFAWLLPQTAAAEKYVEQKYQYMVMLNITFSIQIELYSAQKSC